MKNQRGGGTENSERRTVVYRSRGEFGEANEFDLVVTRDLVVVGGVDEGQGEHTCTVRSIDRQ